MAVDKRKAIRGKIKIFMMTYGVPAEVMAARMHMSRSAWYERMHSPGKFTVSELERLEGIIGLELIKG